MVREVPYHPVVIVLRVEQLTKLVFEKSWLPSVLKRPKELQLQLCFAHKSRYQQLRGKKMFVGLKDTGRLGL